ncbi:MAG: prepilin-type N-terminal cleavage/methylation domain-containing protein [Ruminococcaceae bacterium]|nr:prepilin-type N-terminal cleavage/methylation domain-containing protein [Oscillospiraceae bacterium]
MKNKKGFTTVELVIVIAVIAILATVLIPTFSGLIGKANDSKALQEAKNAYTNYLIENGGTAPEYMLYQSGNRFVALHKGAPKGAYATEREALKAMLDDSASKFIDESESYFSVTVGKNGLFALKRGAVRITASDLVWQQGGVNADTGELNTTFVNNWYSDIKIPNGAEKVRFLTFKTGQRWGSAFFSNNGYISGVCDPTVGYQWITVDIPENATIFRYGYLQDWKTEADNTEMFRYVEFIGSEIEETQHITEKLDRPANGTHAFTVKVNIAPALGKDAIVEATDYGYIMLPENYTKDGEPTRLIITCHGAGAELDIYKSFEAKSHSQTYWLDMGYAIMDMYACPPALGDGEELHYGNPTVLECYEKGYEYVMKRFNLKTDGVFVLGSSMGGLSSFQIVQSGKFPVLAQVANCPVIDLYKQAYCNPWATGTYQRERISSYFGFEGVQPAFTNTKHTPTQAEIDYFRHNFDKVIPYSPIFAKLSSCDPSVIFEKLPANATVADAQEAALYTQLTATHPCPLLIIHNKDDATVSYRYSEYLTGMLERGGATVKLKLYDTGNHNAWDNGPQGQIDNYNGKMVQHSESRRLAIEFFRSYETD